MQLTEMARWHSESIQMSSQLCVVAALHCKVGRLEHMLKYSKCFTQRSSQECQHIFNIHLDVFTCGVFFSISSMYKNCYLRM